MRAEQAHAMPMPVVAETIDGCRYYLMVSLERDLSFTVPEWHFPRLTMHQDEDGRVTVDEP